jgi:sortase A
VKAAIRLAGSLVMLAGACLTGREMYLQGKAALASALIRRAWDDSLRTGDDEAPWPWADTHPIGRLRIPRLGYDEIVLEGASPRTLAFGPARVRDGAELGTPGAVVLAGHRTSWFRPLERLVLGDAIELLWRDARGGLRGRRYVVDALRVADPKELPHIVPSDGDVLTLLTCYPFGARPTSPQRYVVRAVPEGAAF